MVWAALRPGPRTKFMQSKRGGDGSNHSTGCHRIAARIGDGTRQVSEIQIDEYADENIDGNFNVPCTDSD
jgi:hypothetical protein